MQNRLKSKVLWLAMFALVGFILGNWGLFELLGLTSETFNTLTELILAVLIGLGVVNNPTDQAKW